MKKNIIILMLAMVGFLFASMQSANAQVNYSFLITWVDDDCNCGVIVDKELTWELWDINASPPVKLDYGDENVTNYVNNTYTVNSNANIIYDCRGCYQMKAWVRYKNSFGGCCSGNATKNTDGDKLVDGTASINVEMN